MDKDQAEAAYNDIYISHGNYKEKAMGEISTLKKQIEDLTKQLKEAQAQVEECKARPSELSVDIETMKKVQEHLKKMEEENKRIISETALSAGLTGRGSGDDDPIRRRTDGRRVGVVVKDGSEADKKRQENKKSGKPEKSNISSSTRSYETSAILELDLEDDNEKKSPPRSMKKLPKRVTSKVQVKRKDDSDNMIEGVEGGEGDESEVKTVMQRKQARATARAAKPIVSTRASAKAVEEDDGDEIEVEEELVVKRGAVRKVVEGEEQESDDDADGVVQKRGKTATKYKPVQRVRGKASTTQSSGPAARKPTTRKAVAEVKSGLDTPKDSSADCPPGDELKGGEQYDNTDTAKAKGKNTSIKKIGRKFVERKAGDGDSPVDGGTGEEGGQEDMGTPPDEAVSDIEENSARSSVRLQRSTSRAATALDMSTTDGEVNIVHTLSSKRITRLASLESNGENPQVLLKMASLQLLEDESIAEEAGVVEETMKETFFRQFSELTIEEDMDSFKSSLEVRQHISAAICKVSNVCGSIGK